MFTSCAACLGVFSPVVGGEWWLPPMLHSLPPQAQNLAMYFLELSLLEVDCLCFEPAQLSLAALCLAQRVLQEASQEGPQRLLTYR